MNKTKHCQELESDGVAMLDWSSYKGKGTFEQRPK